MPQYTIRNVPEVLDRRLRERARRKGISLNDAAVEALARGLGVTESEITYDDLDDLIGSWKPDDEFDRAMVAQDTIDGDAWR